MKNLFLIIMLALAMVSCNTSREAIVSNAVVIGKELTAAQNEVQSVQVDAAAILKDTEKLKETAKSILKVQRKVEALRDELDPIDFDLPIDTTAKFEAIIQTLEKSSQRVTAVSKDIHDRAERTDDTAEMLAKRIELAAPLADEIVEKSDGVKNTSSGLVSWLADIKWIIFAVLGLVVMGLIGPTGVAAIRGLLVRIFSGFAVLLPARDKEVVSILYDAHEDPNQAVAVDPVITRLRADKIGEAAWQREKRKRQEAKNSSVPEFNTS